MMKKSIFKAFTLIIVCAFSASSNASIITFNDLPGNFRNLNLPVYSEGGFQISVSCTNCVNVISTLNEAANYPNRTGAIGWGASGRFLETWNNYAIFTFERVSGEAFDFLGFNIGWYNNSTSNANWSVRVYDEFGSQIGTADNYLGKGFFALNYRDIYSVEFQNNGGFSSFDNIQVPEPSTIAILALGLIGLGARRFKK